MTQLVFLHSQTIKWLKRLQSQREEFQFKDCGFLFSKKTIDQNLLDQFEELLIQADVGVEVALNLKEEFKKEKIGKEIKDEKEILNFLSEKV